MYIYFMWTPVGFSSAIHIYADDTQLYIISRSKWCVLLVPAMKYILKRWQWDTRKYDHTRPVIYKLHWLPAKYRIICKIILLKTMEYLAPN